MSALEEEIAALQSRLDCYGSEADHPLFYTSSSDLALKLLSIEEANQKLELLLHKSDQNALDLVQRYEDSETQVQSLVVILKKTSIAKKSLEDQLGKCIAENSQLKVLLAEIASTVQSSESEPSPIHGSIKLNSEYKDSEYKDSPSPKRFGKLKSNLLAAKDLVKDFEARLLNLQYAVDDSADTVNVLIENVSFSPRNISGNVMNVSE